MREWLFFMVILLANMIQGITGFAGTILAMPFGILLVGYEAAKPVLNVLGLLSGIYVFAGSREYVNWKEFRKIVGSMTVGILAGGGIKLLLNGQEELLYKALGIFVIAIAVRGLYQMQSDREDRCSGSSLLLLMGAGIAHGIFVSGGPLLIGYLTKKIKDKEAFRATISTVWIVLNTIIMAGDVQGGLWTPELLKLLVLTIPFLLLGMFLGGRLYQSMSQRHFMRLTYSLLGIAGATLLLK